MTGKIICPLCNKDLTEALSLLNADFSMHMAAHEKEDLGFIILYKSFRKT